MPDFLTPHPKAGFRYQRRVPKALRELYGKTMIVRYVPGPLSAAKNKAIEYAAQDQRTFDALAKATPDGREAILANGYTFGPRSKVGLDTYGKRLPVGTTAEAFIRDGAKAQEFLTAMRDPAAFERHVQLVARLTRQAPDPAGTALALREMEVSEAVRQQQVVAIQRVVRKANGKSNPSALSGLVDVWQKATGVGGRSRTPEKYRKTVEAFAAVVGDVELKDITPDHVAKFRDHNEALRLSEHNQSRLLTHLGTMFKAAVSERVMNLNPAAGIRPRRRRTKHVEAVQEKRRPFTGKELRTVLKQVEENKFGGRRHADVLWILKLLAFSGARPNEIAQLRKDDVRTIDGVPVLVIHDAGEDQSVKTDNSVRNVPLHPRLARPFLKYVAAAKGPRVFGSMKFYKEGGYAGWIIRNFPKFRRDVCSIADSTVTLYSMRHRFIDAMREANVPEDKRHAISGHSIEKGAAGKYGRGAGLKALASEIARVDPLA